MARKFRNLDEMRKVHARYETSGLTLTDFCESENINKYTFQYWRAKIKSEKDSELIAASPSVGFRQILPKPVLTSGVIRLHLSQDRNLELPSNYPLERLLEIIRGLSC